MQTRRSFLTNTSLMAAVLPLIGACAAPEPRPDFTRIDFADRPQLRLDVARVIFRDETGRDETGRDETGGEEEASEVGRFFPDPPRDVVERWVRQRLAPVGAEGEIQAILHEASVREIALPRTRGVRGLVTIDQSERYDARIVLALRAYDHNGQFVSGVESRIERSTTVPENLGRGERTAIWHRLMEDVARRLDEEMERAIREGDLGRLLA